MIKNLIFDFGDVFINLDKKGALDNALKLFNVNTIPDDIHAINMVYEQGLISTDDFLEFYLRNYPHLNKTALLSTWNSILNDFPDHRLDFLRQLALDQEYKLILLSNTNELHINWIKENISFYEEFKACFDAFYLSHEIRLRKPNPIIFEYVLNENQIKAEDSLFIDDTHDNIVAAAQLGIHTWHINPETDDVTNLMKIKGNLF